MDNLGCVVLDMGCLDSVQLLVLFYPVELKATEDEGGEKNLHINDCQRHVKR